MIAKQDICENNWNYPLMSVWRWGGWVVGRLGWVRLGMGTDDLSAREGFEKDTEKDLPTLWTTNPSVSLGGGLVVFSTEAKNGLVQVACQEPHEI